MVDLYKEIALFNRKQEGYSVEGQPPTKVNKFEQVRWGRGVSLCRQERSIWSGPHVGKETRAWWDPHMIGPFH